MRFLTAALLIVALNDVPAFCQNSPAVVSRADAAATLGSFSGAHDGADEYERWAHSLLGGLSGGYYWNDHVKSEIEVAWSGKGDLYGSENPGLPDVPQARHYLRHQYRSFVISAAQSYHFGRNAYVHPFVTGGIDVERERHDIERPAQTIPVYSADRGNNQIPRYIPVSSLTRTETRVRARPFAATGLKAYFSERAFFRTDVKVAFSNQVEQVVWRAGVGVDF